MKISSQANALAAGQYPGHATAHRFEWQYAGYGHRDPHREWRQFSGLNITPNPVQFNAALNGATQSQLVTISSNVASGALSVTGSQLDSELAYHALLGRFRRLCRADQQF